MRGVVVVRPAAPGEAPALTELAVRSKAYWGYEPALLERWRPELSVPAEGDVWVAVADADADDVVAGVLVLDDDGELTMLFVDPPFIGTGVGRVLWDAAVRRAAERGWRALVVEADPNAAGFYEAMGCVPIGARPSPSELPLLRADVPVTPPA